MDRPTSQRVAALRMRSDRSFTSFRSSMQALRLRDAFPSSGSSSVPIERSDEDETEMLSTYGLLEQMSSPEAFLILLIAR